MNAPRATATQGLQALQDIAADFAMRNLGLRPREPITLDNATGEILPLPPEVRADSAQAGNDQPPKGFGRDWNEKF